VTGSAWISVVIPAYNEERGIVSTVERVCEWLDADGRPYEVLVVDNASTDATVDRVRPLESDRVRLIENESNRGKGYSVRRGMLAATGALRLHCDADCAPSLASLPRMLDLIEHADVVTGSRLAEGAEVQRQPLRRRIVGRTFVQLCRLVLREPTRDLFCGFKLWRADAAAATYGRIHLDGWVYDAELFAMARALGYRIRETGVVWIDREGSRLSMRALVFSAVRDLLAARRHVRRTVRGGTVEPLLAEAADQRP
jgi:glycosyltransferase involved in cell wall biosynthesis